MSVWWTILFWVFSYVLFLTELHEMKYEQIEPMYKFWSLEFVNQICLQNQWIYELMCQN